MITSVENRCAGIPDISDIPECSTDYGDVFVEISEFSYYRKKNWKTNAGRNVVDVVITRFRVFGVHFFVQIRGVFFFQLLLFFGKYAIF